MKAVQAVAWGAIARYDEAAARAKYARQEPLRQAEKLHRNIRARIARIARTEGLGARAIAQKFQREAEDGDAWFDVDPPAEAVVRALLAQPNPKKNR